MEEKDNNFYPPPPAERHKPFFQFLFKEIPSREGMSTTWSGYLSNLMAVSGTAPTLSNPVGATFAYSSGTTAVCTVDSIGALTLKTSGTCTITLTVLATGYNNQTINQSVTITN